MRILITTDAVGGVWTYTTTLVAALTAAGHHCFVAVVGEPTTRQVAGLPDGVEWEAASHALEWMEAGEPEIRAASDWLLALERRWSPDLVHLNQFAYGAAPFDAPTVVVAHSDVWSWFREVRGEDAPAEWRAYRRWVRSGLEGATAVVSPTGYQSRLLGLSYGRSADRVIHNGRPAPAADPRAAPGRGNAAPGGGAAGGAGTGAESGGRSLVLTAGRAWDDAKGVAVLDRALELLGEDAPESHLAGAVEGPGGARFEPRRLRSRGRLEWPALESLYRSTAVYVATSLYEPFGLAPLEAALHGCALLLSDIGSFRELWQDAAVFVPRSDPEALAVALADLVADPARRRELAEAAGARARDRYTVERMTAAYVRLYEELVGAAEGSAVAEAAS